MRVALYEPDIPQNTGAILRLASCFSISVDIIEPCGFVFSNRRLKRSGMDYIDKVNLKLHASWKRFYEEQQANGKVRIILLTTKGSISHTNFNFNSNDVLLLGRESAGVPKEVHNNANERLKIPLKKNLRSLNISMAVAITLSEAIRQNSYI